MTRRVLAGLATVVVAVLTGGCASDDGETADGPTSAATVSTEPPLTPPPTTTPEELAEAEIIATFEGLIADRDDYYSNASSYTLAEVSTESPALEWKVMGEALGEISNQLSLWRGGEVETVGTTRIIVHDVVGGREVLHATSRACLDLTGISFVTYQGGESDMAYTPDTHQSWAMHWTYLAEPDQQAGIDVAGWYLTRLTLSAASSC